MNFFQISRKMCRRHSREDIQFVSVRSMSSIYRYYRCNSLVALIVVFMWGCIHHLCIPWQLLHPTSQTALCLSLSLSPPLTPATHSNNLFCGQSLWCGVKRTCVGEPLPLLSLVCCVTEMCWSFLSIPSALHGVFTNLFLTVAGLQCKVLHGSRDASTSA